MSFNYTHDKKAYMQYCVFRSRGLAASNILGAWFFQVLIVIYFNFIILVVILILNNLNSTNVENMFKFFSLHLSFVPGDLLLLCQ